MQITQKPQTVFLGGVPIHIPNEIRRNDPNFYISYSASARDYGCPTTALVLNDPQMTKFYILCGDHRKQYEAAENLKACLAYYASLPHMQHQYSDKLDLQSSE